MDILKVLILMLGVVWLVSYVSMKQAEDEESYQRWLEKQKK